MNELQLTPDTKLASVLENIKKSIAEIQDIQELNNIHGMASGFEEVWNKYYKSSGFGFEQMFLGWETKVRSERRMGEMLKEMELPGRGGGDTKSSNIEKLDNLDDLGISKMQSHRYQQLAKTPEEKFNQKIEELRLSFTEPTTKFLMITITGAHVGFNSGEDEWYTPPVVIEAARKTMGSIDLDPASSEEANKIVGADTFYTIEQNGLKQNWFENVWMNPPYSMLLEFTSMLVDKYNIGDVKQACVYVINGTETIWCQYMMRSCNAVCFPKGRNTVKCVDKNRQPKPGSPLQGNAIFYFGKNIDRFKENFKQFGQIFIPYHD